MSGLEAENERLRKIAADLAHTLETLYGWWEQGENVLDVNKEWAEDALADWHAFLNDAARSPEPKDSGHAT